MFDRGFRKWVLDKTTKKVMAYCPSYMTSRKNMKSIPVVDANLGRLFCTLHRWPVEKQIGHLREWNILRDRVISTRKKYISILKCILASVDNFR